MAKLPTKGSWKPGQSGNPNGRPRLDAESYEVREMARHHTLVAVEALVHLATKAKSESARGFAANALLDRGWGKPTQPVESNVSFLDTLTLDEQKAIVAALEALIGNEADAAGEGSGQPLLPSPAREQ